MNRPNPRNPVAVCVERSNFFKSEVLHEYGVVSSRKREVEVHLEIEDIATSSQLFFEGSF